MKKCDIHPSEPLLEGRDENARSEQLLARLLSRHADIVGLYNVGAGTQGADIGPRAIICRTSRLWICSWLQPAVRRELLQELGAADGRLDNGSAKSCVCIESAAYREQT